MHILISQFCRWSLLFTGIAYGAFHHRRYSKRENARREEDLRLKPIRDAKLAKEKELARLGKIFDCLLHLKICNYQDSLRIILYFVFLHKKLHIFK